MNTHAAIDIEIEFLESFLSELDEHDRFCRVNGIWQEWSDDLTRARSAMVNRQAVLFARKAGY